MISPSCFGSRELSSLENYTGAASYVTGTGINLDGGTSGVL
jgi:hypothetical protein